MTDTPLHDASNHQDAGHPAGWDYAPGSPHIRHSWLRDLIIGTLRREAARLFGDADPVRVLEVGAGHGTFTDHLAAIGCEVTITEMSRASAEALRERYSQNKSISVHLDETGSLDGASFAKFDLIVVVAVLHHIPDYHSAIEMWLRLLNDGGSLVTFQDPMWYPRQSRMANMANRGSYFAWRIFQRDLLSGLRSVLRRTKDEFDDTNPRDMVEYHALRDGCDELAIQDQLLGHFADVSIVRYWSTQSGVLQRLGDLLRWRSSFGVIARAKL